jgi:hypothetical protein
MTRVLIAVAIAALCTFGGPGAGELSAQMPDARQMSGMPLPVGDMPAGSVSVRVVRGIVSNIVPDHPVELTVNGQTITVKTDGSGRATFTALKIGAVARARTKVGDETLESQEFTIPSTGGIRTMLVATDAEAERALADAMKAADAAAQPGEVTIGSQSRIIAELAEESAEIYYLLEIRNAASTSVQPKTPFVVELPSEATASAILEGSSPQATAAGRTVTVKGPFRPGATNVQVAYRLPYSGGRVEFSQAFPATFEQPNITVEKLPGVKLTSAEFHDVREMAGEGQTYLFAHTRTTSAGTPVHVRIDGVPHHPEWPRYLALLLAAATLGAGAWGTATARRRTPANAQAKQLEARRDTLFAELRALEGRFRSGSITEAQFGRRRRELIADLERVYGDLDEGAAA